jgi:hypothetical protein
LTDTAAGTRDGLKGQTPRPHSMPATEAATVNADLLAYIQG